MPWLTLIMSALNSRHLDKRGGTKLFQRFGERNNYRRPSRLVHSPDSNPAISSTTIGPGRTWPRLGSSALDSFRVTRTPIFEKASRVSTYSGAIGKAVDRPRIDHVLNLLTVVCAHGPRQNSFRREV